MRLRVALGGVVAALALGTVATPSQASAQIECAEGFELVCVVVCALSKPPCTL